MGPAKKTTAV